MSRKVWLIFRREYLATVRTKAFVVALLLLPLMMVLGILLPLLTPLIAERNLEQRVHTCALVDRSGAELLRPLAERAKRAGTPDAALQLKLVDGQSWLAENGQLRLGQLSPGQLGQELSQAVRAGQLDCFVELDEALLASRRTDPVHSPGDFTDTSTEEAQSAGPVRFFAEPAASTKLRAWFERELADEVASHRLREHGVEPSLVRDLTQPVAVDIMQLYESAAPPTKLGDPLRRYGFSIAASLLMFMAVMLGAGPLMQSVLEEKMHRIAEVLVSSVPPFQLMLGKLLAASAVSLTLTSIYFACSMSIAHYLGHAPAIGAAEVGWMLVFQLLALFMYGSVFLAVGSACSDLKATQTLMMPVMVVATLPMLLLHVVVLAPNSTFSQVVSLVPFFTPVLMFVRVTLSPAPPLWQPLLGIVLAGLTAMLCVYVASRIFRIGMLMQGSAPRIGDLKRWFRER